MSHSYKPFQLGTCTRGTFIKEQSSSHCRCLSCFNCVNVKNIWIYVFDELQKTTSTHFVPDLRRCILGVYDENVDNVKIINTVMLLVKMYIMNCKYAKGILFRVAFVEIIMYKVMLLGRLYENDVFVQLAQMFAET